jgi:hypothetical protein
MAVFMYRMVQRRVPDARSSDGALTVSYDTPALVPMWSGDLDELHDGCAAVARGHIADVGPAHIQEDNAMNIDAHSHGHDHADATPGEWVITTADLPEDMGPDNFVTVMSDGSFASLSAASRPLLDGPWVIANDIAGTRWGFDWTGITPLNDVRIRLVFSTVATGEKVATTYLEIPMPAGGVVTLCETALTATGPAVTWSVMLASGALQDLVAFRPGEAWRSPHTVDGQASVEPVNDR